MMSESMVQGRHEQYIREAIPLLIKFLMDNLTEHVSDPNVWDGKEEGKHRDELEYPDMAWVFKFCMERYPVRIFKDPCKLRIGYEFIDEHSKLCRYTMRLAELKTMQEFNNNSLTTVGTDQQVAP
jgi:hypothetical protein